jgi:hypothetical protein
MLFCEKAIKTGIIFGVRGDGDIGFGPTHIPEKRGTEILANGNFF